MIYFLVSLNSLQSNKKPTQKAMFIFAPDIYIYIKLLVGEFPRLIYRALKVPVKSDYYLHKA